MKKLFTLILTLFLGTTILTGCNNENIHQDESSTSINNKEETINLSDFYGFLNKSSDAYTRIRKEKGHMGVAPGTLNEAFYSDKQSDIKNVLDSLNQKVTLVSNMMRPGGTYIRYEFIKKDGSRDEIYILDSLISHNHKEYRFEKPFNIEFGTSKDQIYNMTLINNDFKVYKNKAQVSTFTEMSKIEFIKVNDPEKEILFTLKSDGILLNVYSKDVFSIVNSDLALEEFYKVVSETNFSSLLNS